MAKIPWHFFKIPWQFPDLEKFLFFPDFSLTRGNPVEADSPIYIMVEPDYVQTRFKNVGASSFCLDPMERHTFKVYYKLRKLVHNAKDEDPFFVSKEGKPINNVLTQVCKKAWEATNSKAVFTCRKMRHTLATYASIKFDGAKLKTVAQSLELSLKVNQHTYSHMCHGCIKRTQIYFINASPSVRARACQN